MTATLTRQDCLALPYAATTERKVGMFAAAIETLFVLSDVQTEVFEDGGKWYVAVVKGMDAIDDLDDPCIVAAFTLLLSFDFTDGTDDIESLGDSVEEAIAAQKTLTRWARRSFRIEDKLDALVGTEGAKAFERPAGDSHRLPDMPPRMTGTGK